MRIRVGAALPLLTCSINVCSQVVQDFVLDCIEDLNPLIFREHGHQFIVLQYACIGSFKDCFRERLRDLLTLLLRKQSEFLHSSHEVR
ncbi:UNVERIFIED_CONTAM: hypothetical protein LK11_48805 [Mumia flava]